MAKSLFEGAVKEITKTALSKKFSFAPSVNYVVKRKDGKDEKTFAVLQPYSSGARGCVFEYKDFVKVETTIGPLPVGETLLLEIDDDPDNDDVKKVSLGEFTFQDLKGTKFAVIRIAAK